MADQDQVISIGAEDEDEVPVGTLASPGAGEDIVTISEEDDEDALPKHAQLQADGSVVLPLLYPLTLKFKDVKSDKQREETFSEFRMHRLNGADMRIVSGADRGDLALTAIARSTRIHMGKMRPIFDRLDAADTMALSQVVNHFMAPGQKTGR
ncbi:MAG: hypothetical protein E7K72_02215 [Roseomonas mucosa]|nr:hypothetical protein [Roseomonas mucosa]